MANKMVSIRISVNTECFCKVEVRLVLKNAHGFGDMEVKGHLGNSHLGKRQQGSQTAMGREVTGLRVSFKKYMKERRPDSAQRGYGI